MIDWSSISCWPEASYSSLIQRGHFRGRRHRLPKADDDPYASVVAAARPARGLGLGLGVCSSWRALCTCACSADRPSRASGRDDEHPARRRARQAPTMADQRDPVTTGHRPLPRRWWTRLGVDYFCDELPSAVRSWRPTRSLRRSCSAGRQPLKLTCARRTRRDQAAASTSTSSAAAGSGGALHHHHVADAADQAQRARASAPQRSGSSRTRQREGRGRAAWPRRRGSPAAADAVEPGEGCRARSRGRGRRSVKKLFVRPRRTRIRSSRSRSRQCPAAC